MDSIFNEQLVRRALRPVDYVMRVIIPIVIIIICGVLVLIPQIMPVLLALVVFIIAGGYFLIRRQHVEFEYYLCDDSLLVDKIFGRSSRKRVDEVDLRAVTKIAREDRSRRELKDEFDSVYDCRGGNEASYALIYSGKGEAGSCIMLISPNEKMLAALGRATPKRVWND